MTLGRQTHDFEDQPGGYRKCRNCPKVLPPGEDPKPLCPGPREERSGLSRAKRMAPRNPDRFERIRYSGGVKIVCGPYFRWVSDRVCFACGRYPCVPHHVTTVGNGGQDPADLADVCYDCHQQIEQEGPTAWGRKQKIHRPKATLEERAAELWRTFCRTRPTAAERLIEATAVADPAEGGVRGS